MSADDGAALIVGAGQAGLQAAESLRAGGWSGPVVLLGDEDEGPYHRPPLSKAWLAREVEAAQLTMRARAALERKGIELRNGTAVRAIRRERHAVELADGSELRYRGLVLATGATARRIDLPGAQARGVVVLRTLADARHLAAALEGCATSGQPLVIIGGGFIGLEVAATARKLGVEVAVVEAAPRLLAGALPPQLSEWYAGLHAAHGVRVSCGVAPVAIETADGAVSGVALADGSVLPAGLVLVGVGAAPNDALAREAGLECAPGIVVDAQARTADPAIYAAGDCAVRRVDGGVLRLQSVFNAVEQGKLAAAGLLGQSPTAPGVPWFWSDQFDARLQVAGLGGGADAVVLRGDPAGGAFSAFLYRGDALAAVVSINAPQDHMAARKLLAAGRSPAPQRVADATLPLAAMMT